MIRFAVLLLAAGAYAQQAGLPRGTVRASGEATVTVAPDEARINIGVVTQAKTAAQAAAENARRADAVMSRLKGILGSAGEVKTISYSINADYDYTNKRPTITGYTANNTVEVRIENLKDTGSLIDAVAQNGANEINGIQFTVKDENPVREEALRRAARQAKANAAAIASALGLQVTGVYSAETAEAVVPPRPMFTMAALKTAPTPVSPGTIDVHATVTVTLAVTP